MEIFLSKEASKGQVDNNKRKIAAITASVAAYLEEEKYGGQTMIQRQPVMLPSLWSIYGREEIMRMRMLWQQRIVRR